MRRLVNRDELCMTKSVLPFFAAIIAGTDNFSVANDYGSNRNFAPVRAFLRGRQCRLHEFKLDGFHSFHYR